MASIGDKGLRAVHIMCLDKFQRSNATDVALISNKHVARSPNKSKKDNELKEQMTVNMGKVRDRVQSLSFIKMRCEIENWENKAFDLTCKLNKDNDDDEPHRAEAVIKKKFEIWN